MINRRVEIVVLVECVFSRAIGAVNLRRTMGKDVLSVTYLPIPTPIEIMPSEASCLSLPVAMGNRKN
jgi:hypothetical protein